MPNQHRVSFAFAGLSSGERVSIGEVSLAVLSTPGHTMESISFVLDGDGTLSVESPGNRQFDQWKFVELVMWGALRNRQ